MFTLRIKLGKLYIYLTDHRMKSRSNRQSQDQERMLKRKMISSARNSVCQCCGNVDKLEMHHLLSVKDHPELALEQRNIMLVCHGCHTKIHTDPFLWCRLIGERYNANSYEIEEEGYKTIGCGMC